MRMVHMNNVVILAGGRGSRMGEQTDLIPKPMVKIGGKPMIEHIMWNFTRFLGECRFIVLAGYKHELIEEYFKDSLDVFVLNTGEETQTGGRLGILRNADGWLMDAPFYVCYGDGLTNFDLSKLKIQNEELVNMLVVHPSGRFGEVQFNKRGRVTEFTEKPVDTRWINGGYFIMQPEIMDYIAGDDDILETDIFSRIMMENELYCTPYAGYWHCMDTPKDWRDLDTEYKTGEARWLK